MSKFTSCDDCENEKHAHICIHCSRNPQVADCFKPKPKKKIIDLSMMVGSNIDMEFKDKDSLWLVGRYQVKHEDTSEGDLYICKDGRAFEQCRIRQDHKHFYARGDVKYNHDRDILSEELGLPEGLKLYITYIDSTVVAYEVLEVLSGYKYEWMEE